MDDAIGTWENEGGALESRPSNGHAHRTKAMRGDGNRQPQRLFGIETPGTEKHYGLDGSNYAVVAPGAITCTNYCRHFDSARAHTDPIRLGRVVGFGKGDTIYSVGDEPRRSYKVVKGAVRLSILSIDGHRQILNFAFPGETFGIEIASTYTATAETVADSVLLCCPLTCIARQLVDLPDARRQMMRKLHHDLTDSRYHVVLLGHHGATRRVASFLMRLAADQGGGDEQILELVMGRQDIADFLGLTLETTCRALSTLKSSRIISIPNRHQIVIDDFAALRRSSHEVSAVPCQLNCALERANSSIV